MKSKDKKRMKNNSKSKSQKVAPQSSLGKLWDYIKRFWDFIWNDDSLLSYIANFAVALVFIKFLLFPTLGFLLNNDYPVVAIVSGSMEHKIVETRGYYVLCDKAFPDSSFKGRVDTDSWWKYCGDYYQTNYNLTLDKFKEYPYKNGLNIGDVMVLYGEEPVDIELGEVLVFVPNDKKFFEEKGPVIHRVVDKWQDEEGKYHFRTKGDHNPVSIDEFEEDISEEQVIAVAKFRIPFIGYVKIAMNYVFVFVRGIFI